MKTESEPNRKPRLKHTVVPKALLVSALTLSVGLSAAHAINPTVAYWNFDQGTAGTPISTTPVVDLSGNNNTMYGYNDFYGPSYSTVTPSGSGLSSRHDAYHQDGYTASDPVNAWSPTVWTIEVSVGRRSVRFLSPK